jgi:hypothetical protein
MALCGQLSPGRVHKLSPAPCARLTPQMELCPCTTHATLHQTEARKEQVLQIKMATHFFKLSGEALVTYFLTRVRIYV